MTVLRLIWNTLLDLARAPLMSLIALGIVPTIWMIPIQQLREIAVPDDGSFASDATNLALRAAASAWYSIVLGGQLLCALHLVRHGQIRLAHLWFGVRYARRIILPLLGVVALGAPSAFWVLLSDILAIQVFGLMLLSLGAWVVTRLFLWCPGIVDRPEVTVLELLRYSWRFTRGRNLQLFQLVLLLALPLGVLLLMDERPIWQQGFWVIYQPFLTVVWVRLYVLLAPGDNAAESLHGNAIGERSPRSRSSDLENQKSPDPVRENLLNR